MHFLTEMTLEDLKSLLNNEEISKNQKKKITKQLKWLENVEERR